MVVLPAPPSLAEAHVDWETVTAPPSSAGLVTVVVALSVPSPLSSTDMVTV